MAEKSAKRIIGIDPSLTRTGVAVLMDGQPPVPFSIVTSKKDGQDYERQKFIIKGVLPAVKKGSVIVYEDFADAGRFQVSSKLVERIELWGVMKMLFSIRARTPYLLVRPAHLKSFIFGRASAHKKEVRKALENRWGYDVKNFDEADAMALAIIGKALLNGGEGFELSRSQKSVLRKVSAYETNPSTLRRLEFFGWKVPDV